jgi:hypothetical protein
MKRFFTISVLTIIFLFTSCEKTKTYGVDVNVNDEINYFIWKGLNTFYLWQQDVPDLADKRFANFADLYLYFRGYSSPEDVFENLRYEPGTIDRFSWIVNDYVALENSFQGINLSNGMEFGLVKYKNESDNVFGYVRYVVANSDAESKGVSRGNIFNSIDGTQLTLTNYQSLLFNDNNSYTVGFAAYNNGSPNSNSNALLLTKEEIQENPVAITKVFTEGTKKIGYLLYNQFAKNYDSQLNAAFSNFKSEGINELIIDLRYNGGGSVSTATYLGSMVTGQFNGALYSQEIWNDKVKSALPEERFLNYFTDEIRNTDSQGNLILQETINSLGLDNVYFITTYSSASASELVINSLSSHIDVQLVGKTTRGKQVGSITLYDSDNLQKSGSNLNSKHKYAMQPLVLEISNKDNKNYPDGIIPGNTLPGIELGEDYNNLGVLGERSDPLLDRTLVYITTGSKGNQKTIVSHDFNEVYNSKLATPAKDYMFIEFKK